VDEEYEAEGHAHGVNWPNAAVSKLNWTDPLILVTTTVELIGECIQGVGQLAGSMLKAHSNVIGERQKFKAEAGAFIESLTNGVDK
jgi:hypothetical protein